LGCERPKPLAAQITATTFKYTPSSLLGIES
jgi:hypothetical protein